MNSKEAFKLVLAGKANVKDFIFKLSTVELEDLCSMVAERLKDSEERPGQFVLSRHALQRMRERFDEFSGWSDEFVRAWFRRMQNLGKFKKAQLKRRYSSVQLLNHSLEKAEYFFGPPSGIYVVVDNTVVTMHKNESKRWKEDTDNAG